MALGDKVADKVHIIGGGLSNFHGRDYDLLEDNVYLQIVCADKVWPTPQNSNKLTIKKKNRCTYTRIFLHTFIPFPPPSRQSHRELDLFWEIFEREQIKEVEIATC